MRCEMAQPCRSVEDVEDSLRDSAPRGIYLRKTRRNRVKNEVRLGTLGLPSDCTSDCPFQIDLARRFRSTRRLTARCCTTAAQSSIYLRHPRSITEPPFCAVSGRLSPRASDPALAMLNAQQLFCIALAHFENSHRGSRRILPEDFSRSKYTVSPIPGSQSLGNRKTPAALTLRL